MTNSMWFLGISSQNDCAQSPITFHANSYLSASDIITIITSLVHALDKPRKDYLYQRESKSQNVCSWEGPSLTVTPAIF